jgi:heat-inducible transcriptional repressor
MGPDMIEKLTERENKVLQAIIWSHIKTAKPTGSRYLANKYRLGISPATVRNTMSDLEDKGFLEHPHRSAGRVPTDKAYRHYVDHLLELDSITEKEESTLKSTFKPDTKVVESILLHSAKVLSVLTYELGIGLAPRMEEGILERLDLIQVSLSKALLVLTVKTGLVKTIFVEVPGETTREKLEETASFLNQRLCGLTLGEIRSSLSERLGNETTADRELLNFFVQSADEVFDISSGEGQLILDGVSKLAHQPEFSSEEGMKSIIELTERKNFLSKILAERVENEGIVITIGKENEALNLSPFSIVTADYTVGTLKGTIGVIGPTRMPYEKVIALVDYTSKMISKILSS